MQLAFRLASRPGESHMALDGKKIKSTTWSRRWFSKRGCILKHQICKFAEMILRDRGITSRDSASLFRGRRNTLQVEWEKSPNALVRGRHLCTQLSIFWRKSRRIASFFMSSMSSTSKIEEVSQNRFVSDVVKFKTWKSRRIVSYFDVVKFKNWGSLAG